MRIYQWGAAIFLLGASQWACGNGDDSTALVPDASTAQPDGSMPKTDGSMSASETGSSNSLDAAPDDATWDTGSPDAQADGGLDGGAPDSGVSDAMPDADTGTTSSGIACCCDGDIASQPDAGPDGGLVCGLGSLYFGADCSRSCGPCSLPCEAGP